MSDPLHGLALIACDLKAALPDRFTDFVTQVREYEDKCIDDLLAAAPDAILGAQSKANSIRQLRTKLQNCSAIRDQTEKRR